eukprot:5139139-Pleurochrysis_carterae.AAC.1
MRWRLPRLLPSLRKLRLKRSLGVVIFGLLRFELMRLLSRGHSCCSKVLLRLQPRKSQRRRRQRWEQRGNSQARFEHGWVRWRQRRRRLWRIARRS